MQVSLATQPSRKATLQTEEPEMYRKGEKVKNREQTGRLGISLR